MYSVEKSEQIPRAAAMEETDGDIMTEGDMLFDWKPMKRLQKRRD